MTVTRLCNAHIIDPSQAIDGIGYLDITDSHISAVSMGQPATDATYDKKIDCKRGVLAPGLVDMRVQSADPGAEHLESLSTLLAAAAKGGITALACLPKTRPVIDEASAIDSLCLRASRIGGPRLYAYGAATKGLEGVEMAELGLMAEAGAIGFTNGTSAIANSLTMRRLLAYTSMLDRPFIQHCEDPDLTEKGEMNEGETSTRLGLIGMPAEAEVIILDRDLHLLRRTGGRYHVAHLSTRAAVDAVRRAKAEGLAVTADTAPPYFLLNELAVSTYDTAFKLSPPLRSEDDRLAVVEGLADGTIDAITQPFGPAAPGASGVDTLLALSLTLVHQNHITLSRAIELLSLAPSNILDIDGGTLMPGVSANFVLFRPESSWIIKGADFASHSRITPFESHPVQGVVDLTYVNGEQIYPVTALD
jgi:dihydroorotase